MPLALNFSFKPHKARSSDCHFSTSETSPVYVHFFLSPTLRNSPRPSTCHDWPVVTPSRLSCLTPTRLTDCTELFTPTTSPPLQHRSDFNVWLPTRKELHSAPPTSSAPLTLSSCLSPVLALYHVWWSSLLRLHNSLSPSICAASTMGSFNTSLRAHLFAHILTKLPSNFTLLIVMWQGITMSNFCWIIYNQNRVLNNVNLRWKLCSEVAVKKTFIQTILHLFKCYAFPVETPHPAPTHKRCTVFQEV